MTWLGLNFLWLFLVPHLICAQTMVDLLKRHSELTEFLNIFRDSEVNATLTYRQGTLFAPTNKAIAEYRNNGGSIDNYTLMYHLINVAKRTSDLEDVLTSELPGNSPIWITRKPDTNEIYLNDALIDLRKKDFSVKNLAGRDQVLHVIDRVLDPTVPESGQSNLLNPDAKRFLESSSLYKITGVHRVTEFAKRVAQLGKLDMFKTIGRHTFFIPVDEAFKDIQINTVDSKVIDGHVIPNRVIFLRPSELKKQYETAAFSSSLPVFVEFDRPETNGDGNWIVRSDTRSAEAFHRKGVVQTEIIRGNIPVSNGVVHLIKKPLVVIDSNVFKTLENEKESGPTKEFWKLIKEFASDDILALLKSPGRGVTVFVPSNEALSSPTLGILKYNRTEVQEILRLHIIADTVSSDNITEANDREPFQFQTLARNKKLFFNYNTLHDGRRVFFVEGGGVNATITQPDIGATNGVIHMIDRVLGYANQNIFDKLKTDPMLQKTFELTSQDGFNLQFNNSYRRFTLFAPSNLAWEKIYRVAPSEYKKLMMGGFGYHVARIIERHTIVNRAFTIEQLRELSTNASDHAYPINAVHGTLRVENRQDLEHRLRQRPYSQRGTYVSQFSPDMLGAYDYTVTWMHERAQIIRPNIVCTNGIIHIIDNVLMRPDDVTVAYVGSITGSGSPSPVSSSTFLLSLTLLASLLVILNPTLSRV